MDSLVGSIEYLERYVIILIQLVGCGKHDWKSCLSVQERNFYENSVIRVVVILVEIESTNNSDS